MPVNEAVVEEFSYQKIINSRYDILHLHWIVETIIRHPNWIIAALRSLIMLILIDFARTKGTKVIWTIHDSTPHSIVHPRLANWFQKQLLTRIDGYISLSQKAEKIIAETLPTLQYLPHIIIPHGHYRDIYPNNINQDTARKKLQIPENKHVVLFFGYIDIYKNVPHLIKTFRELAPKDWVLVIAGNIERDYLKQEIIAATENDPEVKLFLKYIPDDEIQIYFQSANLVVLPFTEILNSGSSLLALSFNCPILVPNLGSIPEVKEQIGEDWVNIYSGEFTPEVLSQGLNWVMNKKRSSQCMMEKLDWERLSQETFRYYQKIFQQDLEIHNFPIKIRDN
ncbi:glycosyltransferase family 4 protein [Calothrix sp. UHCC 0171]|uniref:glycosyltransferase family 4 protein n=1 Tax=Calothrix sp. UHCC 0171 TaxID=3110245 RepID=UPI002B2069BB|nr:glycosyltransferase family 4 protein [Calothrix sp. UHCC 0171]MEA5569501.1 glycosyltransferase family 4 protein [Calothrix sp. UHCC 0171]